MTPSELHAKMLVLAREYKEALEEHNLGRAGCVRDEAAVLLAQEWETVLAALDEWADVCSAQEDNVPGEDEDAGEDADWPERDGRFIEDEVEVTEVLFR